jgi:SAM-dependent methyltransferase
VISLAWDHNTYHHERLLRALPENCGRVLDVGCGAGAFAARLAARAAQVDALDRSPQMIEAARRAVPPNVRCMLGDVATTDLPAGAYDAITSISALHHMDLTVALPRLAAALRPGGILIAVSHHRPELPRELPAELVRVAASNARRAVLLCLPDGRRYRREMYRRLGEGPVMPVLDPGLSIRQVRSQAADCLPGVTVRWLVYWRYQLTWVKPAAAVSRGTGTADGPRGPG